MGNRQTALKDRQDYERPTSGKHFSRLSGDDPFSQVTRNYRDSKKIDQLMQKLKEYDANETLKEFMENETILEEV